MSGECDIYKKTLQEIARILNNVSYECDSRVYTLDDDEMGWIFYCRDLAQKVLRDNKDER